MKVGIFFRKQVDEVIHIAGEIIHFLKDNSVEVFIDDAVGHYFAEPSISSAEMAHFYKHPISSFIRIHPL